MPVLKHMYSNGEIVMVDTRLVGRRDKPSRTATGAEQYMKLVDKGLKKARKDIASIADNEFIADVQTMISEVKMAKTVDSAQDKLNKLRSKIDGYHSIRKATKEAKNKKAYGGKAKMAGGGKLKDVPSGNKGLEKLPTAVRNKMGFKKYGGKAKMMGGGKVHMKKYAKGGGVRKARYK
jgi:hypothetical protein